MTPVMVCIFLDRKNVGSSPFAEVGCFGCDVEGESFDDDCKFVGVHGLYSEVVGVHDLFFVLTVVLVGFSRNCYCFFVVMKDWMG